MEDTGVRTGTISLSGVRIDKYVLEGQNEVTFIIPTGGIDSERVQHLQGVVEGMLYLHITMN